MLRMVVRIQIRGSELGWKLHLRPKFRSREVLSLKWPEARPDLELASRAQFRMCHPVLIVARDMLGHVSRLSVTTVVDQVTSVLPALCSWEVHVMQWHQCT